MFEKILMFEKMMKCKKPWSLFCEWCRKNYRITEYNGFFGCSHDFILSIMPLFFDEYGIYICINETYYNTFHTWLYLINNNNIFYSLEPTNKIIETRLEALKAACEKAFEIKEEQLNVKH